MEGDECPWEGKHHAELIYDPIHFNAMACTEDHIFVADSAPGGGVHIHTWNGQHTQSLSHEQLGIQQEDCIFAIHYSAPYGNPTLQLAVGDYGSQTVHSLHGCTVGDIQK